KWHVKEGDSVRAGDVIAEIETDKATMEVEAVDEGTVDRLLVPEGQEGVKVNAVIAVLRREGEAPGADTAAPSARPAPAAKAAADAAPTGKAEPESPPAPAVKAVDGASRVFASPLARRLAREAGIDLAGVKGSGPH